ncbi:hypothetical protein D9M69_714810 [compost metagenome]
MPPPSISATSALKYSAGCTLSTYSTRYRRSPSSRASGTVEFDRKTKFRWLPSSRTGMFFSLICSVSPVTRCFSTPL